MEMELKYELRKKRRGKEITQDTGGEKGRSEKVKKHLVKRLKKDKRKKLENEEMVEKGE